MSSQLPFELRGPSRQSGGSSSQPGGPSNQPNDSPGSSALSSDNASPLRVDNRLRQLARQELLHLASQMSGEFLTAAELQANVQHAIEARSARQANKRVAPGPTEPCMRAMELIFAQYGDEPLTKPEPVKKKHKHGGDSMPGVEVTYNPHGLFDLITSLASCHELAVEVCKYLPYRDIVRLYSISKAFKGTIDTYSMSTVRQIASFRAPEAFKIYPWTMYKGLCKPDPVGRTTDPLVVSKGKAPIRPLQHFPPLLQPNSVIYVNSVGYVNQFQPIQPIPPPQLDSEARLVPGLRYLGMVLERERMVRDILAALARSGHRMPKTMAVTLKKLWLLMDISTNDGRQAALSSAGFFSDVDLYNAHMFFVKLVMRFNDPLSVTTDSLAALLLGQKSGLYALWCMLRAKRGGCGLRKVVDMKIRYDYEPTEEQFLRGAAIFGVPLWEVGVGHTEGWGRGYFHLMRPDELVTAEAARRGMELDTHLPFMMAWGYRDFEAGKNLVPTREEMYMSDPDLPPVKGHREWTSFGNVPFRKSEWHPHHEMKARWEELSMLEKLLVWREQREERLLHQGWKVTLHDDSDHDGYECPEWYERPDKGDKPQRVTISQPEVTTTWNAINRPIPHVAPLQPARPPPFAGLLGERDRELSDCLFEQMVKPATDVQDALKAQARDSYSDMDMQAWDGYLDTLSDGFWDQGHPSPSGTGSDVMDIDSIGELTFSPAPVASWPAGRPGAHGPILPPSLEALDAVSEYSLGSDDDDAVPDPDLLDHQVSRLLEHLRWLRVNPLRPPPQTQAGESEDIARMRRVLEQKVTKAVFAYDFQRFATWKASRLW